MTGALRYAFDAAEPRVSLADPPPTTARTWTGPLTSEQRREFATTGAVLVPSLLSAAERAMAAAALPADMEVRLRAPLEDCRGLQTAGGYSPGVIWLALADTGVEMGGRVVLAGDCVIARADATDVAERLQVRVLSLFPIKLRIRLLQHIIATHCTRGTCTVLVSFLRVSRGFS